MGRGATFTVRLPLAPAAAGGSSSVPEESPHLAHALANRRVLLIEDVAATRRALSVVLQEAGAEVTAVDSAPAAWDALERERPEIIVSDIGLPTIDGYTFIRQVRTTEKALRTAPIPAVALTAFAGNGIHDQALESGFQGCLTKPVTPARLVETLAALLK